MAVASNPFPPTSDQEKSHLDDPARFVQPLSKFQRPRFYVVGGGQFEFPLGTEGMRLTGAATLAEHKYVSDNAPAIQVMHRNASTIEMTGVFPGMTGPDNVRALEQLLVEADPPDGKRLELPGIFLQAKRVVADTWEFQRVEEQKFDFSYTVTFRITGIAAPTKKPASPAPPTGPKGNPKGAAASGFKVVRGQQTLRTVASQVYGDPDKWKDLYVANKPLLASMFPNANISSMPTKLLPLGTKLDFPGYTGV